MTLLQIEIGPGGNPVTAMGMPIRQDSGIPARTILRFLACITLNTHPNGCWKWERQNDGRGYGVMQLNNTVMRAHRISYVLFVGPVDSGHHVHHKCENAWCVNPGHLVAVTPREHVLEYTPNSVSARNSTKTHCIRGHRLSGWNLISGSDGKRHCRTCKSDWERRKHRATAALKPFVPKTHCKRGHEWIPENWIEYRGYKQCRLCHEIHVADFKRRAKENGHVTVPRGTPRTHCKRGHEMTAENTYTDPKGFKFCRACKAILWQRHKLKRKQHD